MSEFITKVWAFFIKEFHDVRRQPRLMLSLIGGPLLVLGAFGATFRSANPFVRTVLVWPAEGIPGVSQDQAVQFIEANFSLTGIVSARKRRCVCWKRAKRMSSRSCPRLPRVQWRRRRATRNPLDIAHD